MKAYKGFLRFFSRIISSCKIKKRRLGYRKGQWTLKINSNDGGAAAYKLVKQPWEDET